MTGARLGAPRPTGLEVVDSQLIFDIAPLDDAALRKYAANLFDRFDTAAQGLRFPDYGISVVAEDGSLGVRGKITVLGSILAAVIFYGDVRSSLRQLTDDATAVARWFFTEEAPAGLPHSGTLRRKRATTGAVGQIARTLRAVKENRLSREEAEKRILSILESGGEDVPADVATAVAKAIQRLHRDPLQLALPIAVDSDPEFPSEIPEQENLTGGPRVALPPRRRWRVEVWRESLAGERLVKVVPVDR